MKAKVFVEIYIRSHFRMMETNKEIFMFMKIIKKYKGVSMEKKTESLNSQHFRYEKNYNIWIKIKINKYTA